MFVIFSVCLMFIACYVTTASTSTRFSVNASIAGAGSSVGMQFPSSYALYSFVVFIQLDICSVNETAMVQPCDVYGNLSFN